MNAEKNNKDFYAVPKIGMNKKMSIMNKNKKAYQKTKTVQVFLSQPVNKFGM